MSMNHRNKSKSPRPGMMWSKKLGRWVDRDTRSPERRAKDKAIARNAEAEQEGLKEILRKAEAAQDRQVDAIAKAAESLALTLLNELIEARKKSDLSQVEVARRMGVPQSAVVRLESGAHSPTLSTLTRYAAAVGVRLEVRRIA
jgi:DNA-binding XRE family transcriptional regulator